MSRRFTGVACVVLLVAACVCGQNARLDALSGSPMFDDITNVLYSPAYMTLYGDQIEATYDNAAPSTVSPVIGLKSLGDVVSAGVTYDEARVLDNANAGCYAALMTFVQAAGPVVNNVDPLPHLVVGMDFDAVKLALDLYMERAYFKGESTVNNGVNETVTTLKGSFTNMGLLLGFALDPETFPLAVAFGIGLPNISAENTVSVDGAPAAVDNSAEKDKGLFMDGNVEVGLDLLDLDWLIGLDFELLTYKGRWTDNIAGVATIGPQQTDMGLQLYIGAKKSFEGTGLDLAISENTVYTSSKTTPDVEASGNIITTNTLGFGFIGAAEKTWSELKRLDAIIGRCALTYGIADVINHADGADPASTAFTEARTRNQTTRTGFGATVGLGVRKGILACDVEVDAAQLLDVISWGTGNAGGNDLVSVTLGLDFTKLGGSSRSAADSYSAPAAAPASEPMGGSSTDIGGLEF
jgi:hypothetical protein